MDGRKPSLKPARTRGHCRLEPLERRALLSAATTPVIVSGNELTFDNYVPPQHSLMPHLISNGGVNALPAVAPTQTPLAIALGYLKTHAADLGLSQADVASPIVTDQYTDNSSGTAHIYLQQQLNGLPVLNSEMTVTVMRDGQVLSATGGLVPGLRNSNVPTNIVGPMVQSTQALSTAARQLSLPLGAPSRAAVVAGRIDQLSTINAPSLSLDPVKAKLAYVPTASGLKLGWEMVLRTPDGQHWYDVAVGTGANQIIFANDWVDHASYNVLPQPIESPVDGSFAVVTNPQDTNASPFGWHDTNGVAGAEFTDTRGNNVDAHLDTNNNDIPDADEGGTARPSGGAALDFSSYTFNPSQSPTTAQNKAVAQLNLFYWVNLLHDIHYEYGFTEAAGNFQVNDYGKGGLGGDAVQADAQDGGGTNNANFSTPPDGQAPRMQMYIWTNTNPNRDGDLDSQIIVHEYGHGVSTRLTGGPANSNSLAATQSAGMGEGWSDFWALMFTQKPTDTQSAGYPIATYAIGQPPTGQGIRREQYSYDMSIDPLTVQAYNDDPSKEVHHTGEIWASVLWDLNWLLIDKYGFEPNIASGYNPLSPRGNTLMLQLVMDALKIQPSNPSFKTARDAILQADQALTGGANSREIWSAFARRGMGYSFVDTSSSAFSVTPAFDVFNLDPTVLSATPTTGILPIGSVTFNFNQAMNTSSFDPLADVVSFTGPGNVDLRSSITGFSWVTSSKLQVNFTPTPVHGTYTMAIGPNILALDDGHAMDQNSNYNPGEPGDFYSFNFDYSTVLGPDAFGYNAAPFPVQNTDLTIGSPGVQELLNGVDDDVSSIDLGDNTFTFYNGIYGASQLQVSSNGLIALNNIEPSGNNTDLTNSPYDPTIAVLWDDWRTDVSAPGATDSAVLYKFQDTNGDSTPDLLIIEWSDVTSLDPNDGAITFQAILQLNTGANIGRIIFNYPHILLNNPATSLGAGATVGIKESGPQGGSRTLISYNSTHPWVQNQSAIVFGPDVAAPTITSSTFSYLTAQKYAVSFSENVGASLTAADLVLTNTTTSQTINPLNITLSYNSPTKTATFTFNAPLADGNYTATIASAGVTDAAGNPLDGDGDHFIGGDFNGTFFVLAGDANHDRVVDINDLAALSTHWLQNGMNFSQGDFNYDGAVNNIDLGILASHWQMSLGAPSLSLQSATSLLPRRTATRVIESIPV